MPIKIEKDNRLKHIRLMITERCNLNCKYCYLINKEQKDMELETAKKSVDLLFDQPGRYKEIYFFGGEPLIRFDTIKKVIEYAEQEKIKKNKIIDYELNTNGLLITKDILDFLRQYKVRIAFSIDGKQDTFIGLRGTKEQYSQIINNLKLTIKHNNEQARVRATIHPTKVQNLFFNFEYLYDLGINKIAIGPAQGIMWEKQQIKDFHININKIIDFYLDKIRKNKIFYVTFISEYIDCLTREDKERSLCYLGEGLNIEVDGNFTACSYCGQLAKNPKLTQLMNIGHINKGIDQEKIKYFLNYLICQDFDLNCKECKPLLCNHICFVYSPNGEKYPLEFMTNHYKTRKVMYLAVKNMYKNLIKNKEYNTIRKIISISKNMSVKNYNKKFS